MNLWLLFIWACTNNPTPTVTEQSKSIQIIPEKSSGIDDFTGQQHPPIPANNPIWEWDAGGFVPDYGWYGEHNWDDVRMRAIGHLSTAWRDLARIQARQEQWTLAAEEYAQLETALLKVSLKHSVKL